MQTDNKNTPQNKQIPVPNQGRRTNESAGLNIDEFVKIFDPNTQQVHLEKRA